MSTTPDDPAEEPTLVRPEQPVDPGGQRPLRRPHDDRVVAGVCAAVARHLGIDPLLVRIAVVLLSFAAGAGALAYLAGALLIPSEGDPATGDADGRVASSVAVLVGVALLGGALLVLVPIGGVLLGPLLGLGLLGGLGVLAWVLAGGRAGDRPGRVLAAAGLGLALLAGLAALALASFWLAGGTDGWVAAALVVAAGVTLVAGAFVPRGRMLVLPALAVALPVAFVVAAGIDLRGGVGEERNAPVTLADVAPRYDIGMGRLVVDLRDVDFATARRDVDLRVGVGQATVVVPAGVCVAGDAHVGMGWTEVGARSGVGGFDVDVEDRSRPRARYGQLVLHTKVGLGAVEVLTPRQFDVQDGRRDPGAHVGATRRAGTAACAR